MTSGGSTIKIKQPTNIYVACLCVSAIYHISISLLNKGLFCIKLWLEMRPVVTIKYIACLCASLMYHISVSLLFISAVYIVDCAWGRYQQWEHTAARWTWWCHTKNRRCQRTHLMHPVQKVQGSILILVSKEMLGDICGVAFKMLCKLYS